MEGVVSVEGILDPDSEDFGAVIMDTEAMDTVQEWGEDTWEEVLADWAAVIMAMEEALPEVMMETGDIWAAEPDG
jgi:hypothetical protein